MKTRIIGLGILLIALTGLSILINPGEQDIASAQSVKALPTNSDIFVDGENTSFQAYNINGSNYFKIRDIAMALDGSRKQFDIKWDKANASIYIITGKPYIPVGGELTGIPGSAVQNASISTPRLFIDGKQKVIPGYNINGYNYLKLRDLGSKLDFGVIWDGDTNTIWIDTMKGYSNTAINNDFGELAFSHVEYIQNNLRQRISGTQSEKDTALYIQSVLQKIGYQGDHLKTQNFDFKKDSATYTSRNVIATKDGQDERVIIVGAHYDSVNTSGIDDNGGGIGVVLEEAARLFSEDTPYTLQFVMFGAEENGYLGAKYYFNNLSVEEKNKIIMMVNIDSIIAGDKQYCFGGQYAVQVKEAADHAGIQLSLNPISDTNKSSPNNMADHIVFRNQGIPTVFFWSGNLDVAPYNAWARTQDHGQIFHTGNDDLSILNKYFPGRTQERAANYSQLVYSLLKSAGAVK